MEAENKPEEYRYISLQEAAIHSEIYSQEYLSLRARQGKLKAVKFGRNWVTTKGWVDEYIHAENNVKLKNGNGKPKQEFIQPVQPVQFVKQEPVDKQEVPALKEQERFESQVKNQQNIFQFLLAPKFKNAAIALSAFFVLLIGGSVFGYPFLKNNFNELPQKISKPFIGFSRYVAKEGNYILGNIERLTERGTNLASGAGQAVGNFEQSIKGIKDFSEGLVLNSAKETFLALNNSKNKFQKAVEESFENNLKIFSQDTKIISEFSKSAAWHFVKSSEKIRKFVFLLYDNPRYCAFQFWRGIESFQRITSEIIAGYSLENFKTNGAKSNKFGGLPN